MGPVAAPVNFQVVAWSSELDAVDWSKKLPTDAIALVLSAVLPRIGERIVLPDHTQFEVMQVIHMLRKSPRERAKNPPPSTLMGRRTADVGKPVYLGESDKARSIRVLVAVVEVPRRSEGTSR